MSVKATGLRFIRVLGGYAAFALATLVAVVAAQLPYIRWGLVVVVGIVVLLVGIAIISSVTGVTLLFKVDEFLCKFGPKGMADKAARRLEARAARNRTKEVSEDEKPQEPKPRNSRRVGAGGGNVQGGGTGNGI